MYGQVAREEEAELHFELGRPLAERVGYPPALLDAIPAEALASFAGVGHHLDLAALAPGERCSTSAPARAPMSSARPRRSARRGGSSASTSRDGQLEKATRLRDRDGFSRSGFTEARIDALPFEDGTFDAVHLQRRDQPWRSRTGSSPRRRACSGRAAGSRSPTSSAASR